MKKYLEKKVTSLFFKDLNRERSARTVSIGVFIALSPFLGIQTLIALIARCYGDLNTPLLLATIYTINNPFTMVPIALLDYFFGLLICEQILRLPMEKCNPQATQWLTVKIGYLLGRDVNIMTFFVGGVLLAFVSAILSYYGCKRFLRKKLLLLESI